MSADADGTTPVLAAVRAQRIDLGGLVDRRVRLVRRGAPSSTQARSVVGSWLRAHESSDVRQLDAVGPTARALSGAAWG